MATSLLDLLGVVLIGLVAAISLSVMGHTAFPASVATLLDFLNISHDDPVKVSLFLAGIAGLLFVTKSLTNMFLTRRVLQFLANRQAIVSGELIEKLLEQPLVNLQVRSSQETSFALTVGANQATLVILGLGIVSISEATLLIVLAIGLLFISPVVTIFSIFFFFAVGWLLNRVFSGWANDLGVKSSKADIESTIAVQEAMQNYREISVLNRRPAYALKVQDSRWEAARVQADVQFINLVPKYIFESALIVGAGILATTQLLTTSLIQAVAIIAVFLAAGSRIVPSILRLQGAALAIRAASGLAEPTYKLSEDLASWLHEIHTHREIDGNRRLMNSTLKNAQSQSITDIYPGFVPSISMKNVFFTYPGTNEPSLKNISLDIAAGQSVAIVGSTGAGKSTLADVILGVLLPDEGSVQINGQSPSTAISKWSGAIAYVPQVVSLVGGSISENVAFGILPTDIDLQKVMSALSNAHLSDFLLENREGVETQVGEYGVGLSGGQRQRLGLARALYSNPKLIVLDEATSALDAQTERDIAESMSSLRGRVTTITIAHRLATIRSSDLVIYLERGTILAQGTFEEVHRKVPALQEQAKLLGL